MPTFVLFPDPVVLGLIFMVHVIMYSTLHQHTS